MPRTLPPTLAAALRPVLPDLAAEIVAAIGSEVPDYARPLEGPFGAALRSGVREALARFVDSIEHPADDDSDMRAVYVALGRREFRAGRSLDGMARLLGWGHRTAGLPLDEKLQRSRGGPYLLPDLRRAITDAFARAQLVGVDDLDGIETHDCFTITEYVALDHFGITVPGQAFRAIEDGSVERGPAAYPQPALDVRVSAGTVEVRDSAQ